MARSGREEGPEPPVVPDAAGGAIGRRPQRGASKPVGPFRLLAAVLLAGLGLWPGRSRDRGRSAGNGREDGADA